MRPAEQPAAVAAVVGYVAKGTSREALHSCSRQADHPLAKLAAKSRSPCLHASQGHQAYPQMKREQCAPTSPTPKVSSFNSSPPSCSASPRPS